MPVTLYSPTGPVERTSIPLAARPISLAGLRIAVLDNSKTNARFALRTLADLVAARTGATVTVTAAKESAGIPAPDDVITRIADGADMALVGSAD